MGHSRWPSSLYLRLAIPLFILPLAVGCDPDPPKPSAPMPVTITTTPVTIDPSLIDVTEGKIHRSSALRLSGDLRPVWTVTGRLRNISPVAIKSVSLKIGVFKTSNSEVVDETVLVIDTDIPSLSIGSFSRDIQILPPDTAWGWTCEPIKVIPK